MKYTREDGTPFTKEEFLQKLKTDKEFNDEFAGKGIDQIANLINELKTNPDSRRMVVSAWNPTDLPNQVLPPCHYGFQLYTRELSLAERRDWCKTHNVVLEHLEAGLENEEDDMRANRVPTRAISLMFNMRSTDVGLGLGFNLGSYGILLTILSKIVNMVPDELIYNGGDVHLYSNHIEQSKEQIGRELSLEERNDLLNKETNRNHKRENCFSDEEFEREMLQDCKVFNIPTRTREPYKLPNLIISDELNFNGTIDDFLDSCTKDSFKLNGYQSHSKIKMPLSN